MQRSTNEVYYGDVTFHVDGFADTDDNAGGQTAGQHFRPSADGEHCAVWAVQIVGQSHGSSGHGGQPRTSAAHAVHSQHGCPVDAWQTRCFVERTTALLDNCKLQCMWAGTISLVSNGQ